MDNEDSSHTELEFKIHVGNKDDRNYFLTQFDLNTYLLVEHKDGTTHIFTQKKEIKSIVQKILKNSDESKKISQLMASL